MMRGTAVALAGTRCGRAAVTIGCVLGWAGRARLGHPAALAWDPLPVNV